MGVKKTPVGALLQAHRKTYTHVCVVCLDEFTGIDTAIFCGNRCKQEDKDLRRKVKKGDTQAADRMALIDKRKLARKSKTTKRYTVLKD